MAGATVDLTFDTAASERRFLSSYLPDAWDRYESSEFWNRGWFWPYSQVGEYDAGPEGGLVRLVFDGDPDGLLAAEGDRWEAVEGLTDWTVRRYDEEGFESLRAQQIAAKGEVGGDLEYRYKPLTARLALAYREEFDERLPPSASPSEANPGGIGLFGLVHALFVQSGYDWYEENDTYLRGLQNRLKSIAAYRGAEAARQEYDRIREELETVESELEQWLETNEPGTASL